MSHVMNTYARLPIAFTHGEGVWMYDETGKRAGFPAPRAPSNDDAAA